MKPVWEWTEDDVDALIAGQRPEDLSCEYKRSAALDSSNSKKTEISKDVSAMANSAGGVLFYGIDENKPKGPIRLDRGIDPAKYSREWLEQVIDSNIQRRIPGVRIHQIPMPRNAQHPIYAVFVPQSNLGPHMAADKRYHKRLGTTTAVMEEYEVRDVGRRSESPDLQMTLKAQISTDDPALVSLVPCVMNLSPEPAFYATFRIYVAERSDVRAGPGSDWRSQGRARLSFRGYEDEFHCFRLFWGIPERRPLLEGEEHRAGDLWIRVAPDGGSDWPVYRLGCELRSPRMATRMYGALLEVRGGRAQVLLPRHDFRHLA